MKYKNIREEEIKNKLAQDYFWMYDCTRIVGNVDFCVSMHQESKALSEQESLLWAEAKRASSDLYNSIVQLILTIGKARTFDKVLPPSMLGAFDGEKIAFIPYSEIQDIFYQNDFNWNVTPSDYSTKEFELVHKKVKSTIDKEALLFNYEKDNRELKKFIKNNFVAGKFGISKTQIDKNNFIVIYNKWLQTVKPQIAVNWDIAKKNGIIDGDFYLADLLSYENNTLKEKLFVLLKNDHYILDRKIEDSGMFSSKRTDFLDEQVAHAQFWNRYERPPKEEYWDYIVERRDLLVPQDIRERKGSFFTPQIWVELSQKYIADVFGEDWQDEYYVWDCAAGTGNLLAGLTNKYNIWASTLDKQDVEVMHDRIKNGANLLDSHVFQFDFLNDNFSKLPQPLQDIINDPNKRKKLLVYINPPYAEATTARTISGTGKNKPKTATENKTYEKYKNIIGKASNELFTQFLIRIYSEIPDCKIANFSTLKHLQSANFKDFREIFQAKLHKLFLIPADTFDNVKGKFPIGFAIWDTAKKQHFKRIKADVYDRNNKMLQPKKIVLTSRKNINQWIKNYEDDKNGVVAFMGNPAPDFQHNNQLYISLIKGIEHFNFWKFKYQNFRQGCVYFAVRHAIKATWLNDRDQFLTPKKKWEEDTEFQNDCLAFTLFHGQNRISSTDGTNHWIPFSEEEIDAKEKFDSNFMSKFISGKLQIQQTPNLLNGGVKEVNSKKLRFSPEAKAVFEAGRELWQYYHSQTGCNVNASLYDIRVHFQGRNAGGRMNSKSKDEKYTKLIGILREKIEALGQKIEPKVYEYEFLEF
ncbi:MAG: hypothetical protein CSB06_02150 [Bacteroidia bacterium]|nr:MAG: hypothetical protein CSB06_02150 [Bacteroidia bacterium]